MVTTRYQDFRSPRTRAAILALALVLGALSFAPVAVAQGTPPLAETPLEAPEPTHDLGTLIKGDVVSHTFVLRNTGSEALTITRVFPSCGCTVTEFDATIPPGGEGEVRAEVDTATVTGKSSTMMGVFVEGHEDPAAILELHYEVGQKLLAHPGYARWIYVQHEPTGTISQTVYANDGADFDIVSVEAPISAIDVSFREATAEERQEKYPGKQWVISATLAADAPIGPIEGYLEAETTHPVQKKLFIPLSGFVRPTLFVEPQNRRIGTLRMSAPRTMSYSIRNFATDPIALTAAETDVPGVTATLEPVEEGRNYTLEVRFDPAKMEAGPFDGQVRIATDHEAVPTLTVDLEGEFVPRTADNG